MRIALKSYRWLLLFWAGLSLTSPTLSAAESARLGDLRGVWQANFNYDASRLVVRLRSGEMGLWDMKKGTPITGDPALKAPSSDYVLSPDARRVLVGFKDGHARIFDTSSGSALSPVLDLAFKENATPQALFSPDGGTVVFFGNKETSVLDVKTGKRIATIPIPFVLEEDSDATAEALFVSARREVFCHGSSRHRDSLRDQGLDSGGQTNETPGRGDGLSIRLRREQRWEMDRDLR